MIKEQLEEIRDELALAHERYAFELEGMPKGKLLRSKGSDATRYYIGVREGDKYVRRGIGKNHELIQKLARKEYLRRALPIIEHDLKVIERAVKSYKSCQPQQIASELSASYKELPEEMFFSPFVDVVSLSLDDEDAARIASHAEWGQAPYKTDDYRPEGRTVITSHGDKMRSKAEVMIAEKLYEYGIPFRYEQVLELPGGITVHPDFTFEGAGGKEFYLEFCGMMDNHDYIETHRRKTAMYEAAGIVPWKNIIYLYASGNEMNMMRVDSLIRTQIIPWL